MLIILAIASVMLMTGCQKKVVKPKVIEPPKVEVVEEVFDKMEEDEADKLVLQVRDYAETFEISEVEKDLKKEIKKAVPKGSKGLDVEESIGEVVSAFMEIELKKKIAEGLDSIVGRHTEEDVILVYEEMNTNDLVRFIVNYEIERLKMEGYLR
jgi:hypothetical protein